MTNRGFLLCAAAALLVSAVARADESPNAAHAGAYEPFVKGIVASSALPIQFESAPVKLELRNFVMGRGVSEVIPVPTMIWMELRMGAIATTINKETVERRAGDFWTVEQGAVLTIKNLSEVAVIRAIYVTESEAPK
jgi:predicted patatin/cPLA2 family phospholipase